MNQQQYHEQIRRLSLEKGLDPLAALRSAEVAANLAGILGPNDYVIWPDNAGGVSWEVTANDIPESVNPEQTSRRVYVVFPPGGPSDRALWKRLGETLGQKSLSLRLVILKEPGQTGSAGEEESERCDAAVESGEGTSPGGPFVRFLEKLLNRLRPHPRNLESCTTGQTGTRDSIKSSDLDYTLAGWESIDVNSRLGSLGGNTPELPESLDAENFFPLDCRTPLDERVAAAETLMYAGIVPILHLGNGEIQRSIGKIHRLLAAGLGFAAVVSGCRDIAAGFVGLTNLAILTPGSAVDYANSLDWIRGAERGAVVLTSGLGLNPERKAFKQPWIEGSGVVVKDSRTGGAGHVLLVTPGDNYLAGSKAAARLQKDNISVTVLSLRFLTPLDTSQWLELGEESDLIVFAETSDFIGNLKTRVLWSPEAARDTRILCAPACSDPKVLAEFVSRELRERRIRQTVEDVRADRWR